MSSNPTTQLLFKGLGVVTVIGYGLPVVLQLFYGLPFPGTDKPLFEKLVEAATPRRVVSLWGPMVGQLALLKLAPKWIEWQLMYKAHDDNLKAIGFGSRHGSLVDIYPSDDTASQAPIILFVYGGAWSAGSREMYAALGKKYSSLGYLVVIPDYIKYPHGTANDIVSDTFRCLQWLRRSGAKRFGGNSQRITLVGHSAGAHLCAAVISTLLAKGSPTANRSIPPEDIVALDDDLESQVAEENGLNILSDIEHFIGLAGVYNIVEHYKHESSRGVEHVSAMERAMCGRHGFRRNSPYFVIRELSDVDHDLDLEVKFPRCHLIHGENDYTVPLSSSVEFASVLKSLGFGHQVDIHALEDTGHIDILVATMECRKGPSKDAKHRIWEVFSQNISNSRTSNLT